MTFDTIPLPKINFTDIPEKEAEQIFQTFFKPDYQLTYAIEAAKTHIKSILYEQENRDDKIVILSYLINKLSDKFYNLPIPPNDHHRIVQDNHVKVIYPAMLHWFYRLIENEGVAIPQDPFSNQEYVDTKRLINGVVKYLEEQKTNYPDQSETITETQKKVTETEKFLWLGKEKWADMFIGAFMKIAVDKSITKLLPEILKFIKPLFETIFHRLIN